MAALFALGVMSLTWMVVVAVLIAAQKLAPWRLAAVTATVAVLLALGLALLVSPAAVPGLTDAGPRRRDAPDVDGHVRCRHAPVRSG